MDDEARKIFSKFDTNGDGKISSSELKEMLLTLGTRTNSDEVKHMMDAIDQNGDGYIDLKEFADFHFTDAGKDNSDELLDTFNLFDLDKNGLISADELHAMLKKLGENCSLSDCKNMISNVDVDGDGYVNFEEFKKMMAR
ncbi:calcium-binding protein CML24-like [Trifolium pratense]|uniref:calcium-binding protein CML24-like n=1 Tax=Trifolium pratense TaxID=57577 RepID=UPI001E690070|nr:calcium-binding protein CML24-like [Trifolium pratense]